ncbi:MAG: hypothetical protein ACSHX9_07975, partial [Luteolibacter sp.]
KGSNAESMSPINGHEDDEKKVRDLLDSIDASESEVGEMRKKLEAKVYNSFGKALLAGEILCRLKEALKKSKGHGSWEDYVKDRIGCTSRKASMYMRFHTRRDELEKSEIFPKLGIVGANDLLKATKAEAETEAETEELPDASDKGDPEHEDEGSSSEDSLELIDGKKLPLRKLGWAEGLISRDGLDRLLAAVASEKKLSGDPKVAARRQQMIATIASSINRSCGSAKPEQAVEQVRPVLEAILGHLAKIQEVKAA